ncbi:hypothetical protein AB7Z54_17880 [Providencia manganoxydans]|uniref:hypothetical protein n=1 Tax=Morganellaceae TaxID=1903414 RepID=UPI0032DB83C1
MDKSRQQFEAYFLKKPQNHIDPLKKDQFGYYYYLVTREAWEAWQASRESLINSLEPVGYITPVSGLLLRRKQKSFIHPEKSEVNIPLYRLD